MKAYFKLDSTMPFAKCLSESLIDAGYFPDKDKAVFSDANLFLPTTACDLLEEKHHLSRLLADDYSAYPNTLCINDGRGSELTNWLLTQPPSRYIVKPALLNNGGGITICQDKDALIAHFMRPIMTGPIIVQRYIEPPMLLNGAKFSQRLFVVVTNFAGAYLYPKGYTNVCLQAYAPFNGQNLAAQLSNEHLASAHQLTNTMQLHSDETPLFADYFPLYMSLLSKVVQRFEQQTSLLFSQPDIYAFSTFGVDFMLDESGTPWLLEFNHCPCFPTSLLHPLYQSLYQPFFTDIVNEFVPACIGRNSKPKLASSSFKRLIHE